ncbi:MAG: energy transducer TonB [Flavobacteriales bacterium]|nr:energy transducer TonB [Flavobacteriales bacterium]
MTTLKPDAVRAQADTSNLNGNRFPSIMLRRSNYPDKAVDAQIEGVVIVGFTVDTLCQISNKHVIKGIGYGCDEEAIKVIDRKFEEILMKENHFHCHPGEMSFPVTFKLN